MYNSIWQTNFAGHFKIKCLRAYINWPSYPVLGK